MIEVELRGGPYDGKTVTAPEDFQVILMPGEVEARLIGENDIPDETKPLIYKRQGWRN